MRSDRGETKEQENNKKEKEDIHRRTNQCWLCMSSFIF